MKTLVLTLLVVALIAAGCGGYGNDKSKPGTGATTTNTSDGY